MITQQQKQIIKRCQASVTWFLRNYGKLKHPSAGIVPFYPFSYQREAIKAFRKHRLNIFRKCRQAGASKIAGAFALWFAMFHNHKTILIVSRRDEDAMSFLREQIVFLFEHLPDWMREVWKPVKQNEHEIMFPNGSRIQSLTSHPDVLRSNASSLNIIDEAAFIQGMDAMWCVSPATMVMSDTGLYPIIDIKEGDMIYGTGWRDCYRTHYMSERKGYKITTDYGYSITCGEEHLLMSNKQLIKARDLKIGDRLDLSGGLPIVTDYVNIPNVYDNKFNYEGLLNNDELDVICHCGNKRSVKVITLKKRLKCGSLDNNRYVCEVCSQTKKRNDFTDILNEDLAEFIGLYIGDGHATKKRPKRITISCDPQDKDLHSHIINKLKNIGITAVVINGNKTKDVIIRSANVSDWLDRHGLLSKTVAHDAIVPRLIMRSPSSVIAAFLRGYFEADGWHHAHIGCYSVSKNLIEQIQYLLLILGIRSAVEYQPATDGHYGGDGYRLEIRKSRDKILFNKVIGFISNRKRDPSNDNIVKYEYTCDKLTSRIDFQETIRSIEPYVGPMCDVTLSGDNLYNSNGFISHNSGGWPTLQHGGNVIVISTTNGVGGWYWATCTEAEAGTNMFNPIVINWYDMDWEIEYVDPITRKHKRIAPRDGIRKCVSKEDILKYGPYWSPWLEEQYNALNTRGEAWKFEQEILASFIGSGNTVLPKEVLAHLTTTVKEPMMKVSGIQSYVHPVTGDVEELSFDFDTPEEGLWVWSKPVLAVPEKRRGNEIISIGQAAHPYVMGVDTATGKGKDFHAIEVFDIYTREQVAEFMARCLPRELIKYIDRIGRWYNCALAVIERNNGGDIVIDELRYQMMYPRLWRRKEINDKPKPGTLRKARALKVSSYGFSTSMASKPTLNQFLLNNIRDGDDDGYTIYSQRLLKQFHTYVRKRDRLGHDTSRTEAEEGAGNFDDLVIAAALGLLGASDTFVVDAGNMTPFGGGASFTSQTGPTILTNEQSIALQSDYASRGGSSMLMPMSLAPDELPEITAQRVLDNYTLQLGGIPISEGKPLVTPSKFFYNKK